jgi:hypothetical protein
MTIITNSFSRTNTQFFLGHRPFPLQENENVVDSLADMYSINVIPQSDAMIINDEFGAANTFEFIVSIKNLTTNTTLIAEIDYGELFVKEIVAGSVLILPEQIVNLTVKADRFKLDNKPTAGVYDSTFAVTIRNQKAPFAAIKNMLTPTLSPYSLPKETTIV